MPCRGLCKRQDGYTRSPSRAFKDGRHFCPECSMAYKTVAKYCACCGLQLRIGPRRAQSRHRIDAEETAAGRRVYIE